MIPLLAQEVETPIGDPFISLLFRDETKAIFLAIFVVLAVLIVRAYLRRPRPSDMDDDEP